MNHVPPRECGQHIREYLLTTPGATLERLLWDLNEQILSPETTTVKADVSAAMSFDVAAALDQESANAEAEFGVAIGACLLSMPMATLEGLLWDLNEQILDPETDPATARNLEALSLDVARAIYDGDDETAALLNGG
jgi:hypothetical protein